MAGGGAGGQHAVVDGIGTAQAHTADADGFGGAHVFVVKQSGAVNRQGVTCHAVVAGGHAGVGTAVVYLVHAGVVHAERAWRDLAISATVGGGGVNAIGQHIVGCINAAQGQIGEGEVFIGAAGHVFVGIGANTCEGDGIGHACAVDGATHQTSGGQRGVDHGGVAVVHLAQVACVDRH